MLSEIFKKLVGLYNWTYIFFGSQVADHLIAQMRPYIGSGKKVLDIGAGVGVTSKRIADKLGVRVTLVDVVDKKIVDLPQVIYDGKHLPFEDKSFDVSLLVFVLHHTEDPEQILREAKRVTRDKIIVYEDIVTKNPFDRTDTFLHGWLFNKSWKLKNEASFKTREQWLLVFKRLNLKVVRAYVLPVYARLIYPVFRMQFVLKV